MYCRNCGNQIDDKAAVCVKCGVAAGTGTNYCQNCGTQTAPGAAVCTNCGFALAGTAAGAAVSGDSKSKMAAGLLGIFLGSLGIHNFYLGYTSKAIIQLVVCLAGSLLCGIGPIVAGIWGLVEGIMILTGKINVDAKGVPLKD